MKDYIAVKENNWCHIYEVIDKTDIQSKDYQRKDDFVCSSYSLKRLPRWQFSSCSNYEALHSIYEIEEHYNEKIKKIEESLERTKNYRKMLIEKAIKQWVPETTPEKFSQNTQYGYYYDNYIIDEEIE